MATQVRCHFVVDGHNFKLVRPDAGHVWTEPKIKGATRMRRILAELFIGCAALCVTAQTPTPAGRDSAISKRPVRVADVIGMTQIGDRSYLDVFTRKGNVAQFSPDGSKFAFVTQKGDLKSDTVEFSLLIFKTADAFSSPHAEVAATFAASSNREAITDLTWLADNDTIVFLGERPGEHPQIYRVNTTTKKLTQLTSHPTSVLQYSMTARGESFVYLADAARPAVVIDREMLRRGFPVTSQSLSDIYSAGQPVTPDSSREIFAKTPQMDMPQRIGGVLGASELLNSNKLSISPNGKYATVVTFNLAPPALWNEYKPGFRITSTATSCSMTDALSCPMQYLLLDLEKKTAEPLMNAPVLNSMNGSGLSTWTQGNSLLLVNAFLPLDSVDAKEREDRRTRIYAAEVILPEKKVLEIAQRLTPFDAFSIHPGSQVNQFVTHSYNPVHGPALEFYRDSGGGWKITEASPAVTEPADRLSVTLDQDMNSPPKLVANDPNTKRRAVLFDLNPQFAQLTFGHVEVFQWKTPEGRSAVGSLYFPPDYMVGKRYPLVIQTHGFSRDRFWPDGPFTTTNAAQPLANRGFIVLQMAMGNPEDKASLDEFARMMTSPMEGTYCTAFFESAVDELDRRGLVDPSRVGLSGFSRTEYHVLYALTHSDHHFAAAVVADGVTYGYVHCVFYAASHNSSICKDKNGGFPYGDTLAGWAREAPTFRLNKIEAPLLLQAILAPLGELEILAGLRWLKKPVEMLNFYPEGEHVLVRPQQRLLSQGSVVDWYCFWLKGEEDPDPAKAEQYARWRKMKQERDHKTMQAGSQAR
jgi:dipeptidyl aminopeptidase/acylaminoacyl peptidase